MFVFACDVLRYIVYGLGFFDFKIMYNTVSGVVIVGFVWARFAFRMFYMLWEFCLSYAVWDCLCCVVLFVCFWLYLMIVGLFCIRSLCWFCLTVW